LGAALPRRRPPEPEISPQPRAPRCLHPTGRRHHGSDRPSSAAWNGSCVALSNPCPDRFDLPLLRPITLSVVKFDS